MSAVLRSSTDMAESRPVRALVVVASAMLWKFLFYHFMMNKVVY